MPSTCCVVGCRSLSHRRGKKVEGVGFYSFPSFKRDDPLPRVREITRRRRMAWISAIQRPEFTFESKIPAHVKVCSRHFHRGKPAYVMLVHDPDWAPSLHLGHTGVKASAQVHEAESAAAARLNQEDGGPAADPEAESPDEAGQSSQITWRTKVCSKHFTKKCFQWDEHSQRTYLTAGSVPVLFPWTKIICVNLPVSQSRRNAEEEGLPSHHVDHNYFQPLKMLDTAHQEINQLMQDSRFCPQRFENDSELLHYYTGFQDYDTLRSVFLSLEPTADCIMRLSQAQKLMIQDQAVQEPTWVDLGSKMSLFDQFFLFLCRVRQGASEEKLAHRFHVSVLTVRGVVTTWANYLFSMLSSLPLWLHRSAVKERMPRYFKESYPRTRVILDCVEVRIEQTSSKVLETDSKDSTTLKGLVAFSPSGEITFVSRLFEGSISTKEMTKQSGILSLLEEGDEVMADESFHISDLLSDINVSLVTLPCLDRWREFIHDDVHGFHLQRFKDRIRQYHIFDSVLPLSLLGAVNQLWCACVMLANFQSSFF